MADQSIRPDSASAIGTPSTSNRTYSASPPPKNPRAETSGRTEYGSACWSWKPGRNEHISANWTPGRNRIASVSRTTVEAETRFNGVSTRSGVTTTSVLNCGTSFGAACGSWPWAKAAGATARSAPSNAPTWAFFMRFPSTPSFLVDPEGQGGQHFFEGYPSQARVVDNRPRIKRHANMQAVPAARRAWPTRGAESCIGRTTAVIWADIR